MNYFFFQELFYLNKKNMGVKNSKKSRIIKINRKKEQESYPLMSNSFEFKYIIGRGGFGKVWKVVHKKTGVLYALKQMSKAKIIEKKSERAIKYERDLLVKIHHPFIVNMHYAFQDYQNIYIVLDLLTGGDLRYHLSQNKKFTEEQTSN
jgi:serine/threonine protein kinase